MKAEAKPETAEIVIYKRRARRPAGRLEDRYGEHALKRLMDKVSIQILMGFFGVYSIAVFIPIFFEGRRNATNHLVKQLEFLTLLEPWVVVVFFLSFVLLLRAPFLPVLLIMLIGSELYRQAPINNFVQIIDGLQLEYFIDRRSLTLAPQIATAILCLLVVCLANSLRLMGRAVLRKRG